MKRNATYERLYQACRLYWNEFDPIGVRADLGNSSSPDWFPDDEYDSYVPHTVALVIEGADAVKLLRHIEHCCTVNMGLSPKADDDAARSFVDKLVKLQKQEVP